MRTTLTIEDDVAAQIAKLRRESNAKLRDIVNRGLREGLRSMSQPEAKTSTPFRTQEVSLGRCLLPTIDDVSESLAIAEGETYR
jgi:hypothetical protein